jgi:uncharacterized membrane protein YphA (DoxX/SURF4 family)
MSVATTLATTSVTGTRTGAITAVVPLARGFLSAIFLTALLMHLNPATIAFARSAGVPFAEFLVPASGLLAFLGGLSVLVGWHARAGARRTNRGGLDE